jgi:hypothetical protein
MNEWNVNVNGNGRIKELPNQNTHALSFNRWKKKKLRIPHWKYIWILKDITLNTPVMNATKSSHQTILSTFWILSSLFHCFVHTRSWSGSAFAEYF